MIHKDYDKDKWKTDCGLSLGDPKKYGTLLSQPLPAVIETEEQNEGYLAIVEKIMRKGEDNISPEEETLLNLLDHLIEDFEQCYYQPKGATRLELLHMLMESNDLKQADLVPIFGSKGLTSEVINGRWGISKTNAKALGKFFTSRRPHSFHLIDPPLTEGAPTFNSFKITR